MRHSRTRTRTGSTSALTSIALVAIALAAIAATWAGCAAGDTTIGTTSGTGSGGRAGTGGAGGTATSTGGAGGSGGCAATEKVCNGVCVKVDDPAFGCSQTGCDGCPLLPNAQAACAGGVCVFGNCDAGFKNCDGNDANGCETNVEGDPTQCGACGSPCVVPHATPNCVAGVCGVGTCANGYVDCDGDPLNGCEAQPEVDPKNCGTCGVGCPPAQTCEKGVCGLYCAKGKANCDGDENNGCETPLGSLADCAFCGDACAPANAQASCDTNGVCTLDQCNMGWANCDTSSANGCETNTSTDAGNCGSCGNVCPSGPNSTAVCENGGCKLNCDPGWSNCDNNPTNGCEVHSDIDKQNCGGCGTVCNTPNATPACAAGTCLIAQCNPGFADCDMNPANGCEIDTKSNPNNCGGCGTVCTIANGTAGCTNGACTVGTCNPGWADCDGLVSNGCETNVGADTNNCGTCGNVCNLANANQACTGGICTVGSCKPGFANCNNTASDGCEINTTNNPLNCGACNSQCFVANGTAGCANSTCTVASCNTNWGNCNGFPQDGCETNLLTDGNNCGTCGTSCNASCTGNVTGTTCGSGTCQITGCAGGYTNLDGTCSNGCECQVSTTASSCPTSANLGTFAPGQASTPFSSTLIPAFVGATPNSAWFVVTFTGQTNVSTSPTYKPKITLTDPANEFLMDVYTSCSLTLITTCTDNGASGSSGVKTWETSYVGPNPKADSSNASFTPTHNGTFYVKVYRKNPNSSVTCNQYTLSASN